MAQEPDSAATPAGYRPAATGVEVGSAAAEVRDDLDALRAVVEGTASGTGTAFFRSLVRHLAEAIDVHYAAVCEFDSQPRCRVHAVWDRDHVLENLEFELTASPAMEVLSGKMAHFPTGVSTQFPQSKFWAGRNIEGYMAVPFPDSAGNMLGFLSVFDERPMPAEPRRLFILRIFAARAAAEIERLRSDKRLQESEARFRDLFENAPNAYLVVGLDGRILSANRQVTEIFGYPVEEVVGSVIHSFLPDTPAGKSRSLEVSRKQQAGEAVSGWEMEMRRKDGRPLWVQMWMRPVRGDDGSVETARSFFVDITERVLAEREQARLQEQNLYLQEEIKADHNFEQIIGRSSALQTVLEQVGRVSPTDASVLVTGETGTGKELFARAVHSSSRRKDKPLIKVNCAALPAGLVESELFGHEKGAFSGAIAKRLGRFELADGGTIFLDEIGELPAEAQVKLLRVLQEREFDRIGGVAPVQVDVRIIAATNRDLVKEIQEKTFREDLYYRLNVFPIRLPPLRERKEDIPLLVHFMVNKFALRIGKHFDGASRQTMQRLLDYTWPGNIRELENVLERAVILMAGSTLDIASDLLPTLPSTSAPDRRGDPPSSAVSSNEPPSTGKGASRLTAAVEESRLRRDNAEDKSVPGLQDPVRPLRCLNEVERDYILTVLKHTNWLITGSRGAASVLGLNPSTLRSRIKKLGISRSPD
jgi:PAS domain S-box-containing protein